MIACKISLVMSDCDPMDCNPQGSSVHAVLQTRVLKWFAISSSRGSYDPGTNPCLLCLLHRQVGSLPLAPPN